MIKAPPIPATAERRADYGRLPVRPLPCYSTREDYPANTVLRCIWMPYPAWSCLLGECITLTDDALGISVRSLLGDLARLGARFEVVKD